MDQASPSSTFPADDLPDRHDAIVAVLEAHHPVPVPPTRLYLSIPDKRHLAEAFDELVAEGTMERVRLGPDDPHFDEALALAGLEPTTVPSGLEAYRLVGRDD